jgi:predicted nucleotidyltransferase
MYLEPMESLSKTSIEILSYLSSRIRESFTVRQIAEAIKKDYKITHVMTMRLAAQHYIIAEKKPPVTYCRLNLKGNSSLFAYIEAIRASRFFAGHQDLEILVGDLKSNISLPFFTLILFGSHVKGRAQARSDLDILFIIPERKFEKEVTAAVGSVQHVSPLGIHEIVLTNIEFMDLLKQKKPNVAWEAVDNRIVPYGAEMLFKMLEEAL